MAPLEKSRAAKVPAQSVLASVGAPAGGEAPTPVAAMRNPIDRDWEKLKSGALALDRIGPEHVQGLLDGVDRKNQQDRKNLVRRIVGEGAASRILGREITTKAVVGDRSSTKPLVAPAPGTAPAAVDGAAGGWTAGLSKVAKTIKEQQKYGAHFRERAGFGLGMLGPQTLNLIADDETVAATLTKSTVDMLADDRRFALGLQLFRAAASGKRPKNLAALAPAAVAQASQDHGFGDSLIFESMEDRVAAIVQGVNTLARKDISKEERDIVRQALTIPLFAEAMESRRTYQMLMDMAPILGNIRDAESAIKFSTAAINAFDRGDYSVAAKLGGAAALSILGAVGGTGLGVVAKNPKALAKSYKRALVERTKQRAESIAARESTTKDAARVRLEEFLDRPVGNQNAGIDMAAFNQRLEEIAPGLASHFHGHIRRAVGKAGEDYFAPILARWRPDALIGIDIERLDKIAKNTNNEFLSNYVKNAKREIRLSRNGKDLVPDALIDHAYIDRSTGKPRLLETAADSDSLPLAADVKTGGLDTNQTKRYVFHQDLQRSKNGSRPTISGYGYFHINGDEWRRHFAGQLRSTLESGAGKSNLSKSEINKVRRLILETYETADIRDILADFLTETGIAASIRANHSSLESHPNGPHLKLARNVGTTVSTK